MDLINKTDLRAVRQWINDAERKNLNKRERELVDLLRVLTHECTPYLGYHASVERALANFAEQMCGVSSK